MRIICIDVGGDRLSYGFSLVMHSIKHHFGDFIEYVSNSKIESITPLQDDDIILFSFMFVENYLSIGDVFKKLKISPIAEKRKQIIIAGGSPISENPEPISKFLDVCVIGEGEFVVIDILKAIFENEFDKNSSLEYIYNNIISCYVPKFYKFQYNQNGTINNISGRKVVIKHEDINKVANELYFDYTRNANENSKNVEHSLEYHRGCKRKCTFCSYGWLQSPYRQINDDIFESKIKQIALNDKITGNKIVPIQTNFFHYKIKHIEQMEVYNKMVNYCSACVADVYSPKMSAHIDYINNHNRIYFRFGVESFTEQGRKQLHKPISNDMLINLPVILQSNWHLKWFFISGLPNQTESEIDEFESILEQIGNLRLSSYITLECYVTVMNYKLCTPIANESKIFNEDFQRRLMQLHKRKYGKLNVEIFKNQGKRNWYVTNLLSLSNSLISDIILSVNANNFDRDKFISDCSKVIDFDVIFAKYDENYIKPNSYIEYHNKINNAIEL